MKIILIDRPLLGLGVYEATEKEKENRTELVSLPVS